MATKRKAAPKKGVKQQTRTTRIEVGSEINGSDTIQLVDGVPLTRLRSTPEEQKMIRTYLNQLQPNRQHLVVPLRLKTTVLRMASTDYQDYRMKTATNKDKNTVSIWRVK